MLQQIMSAAGLSRWAEVALVVFFVTFVLIALWAWVGGRRRWEKAASLPLDDGEPSSFENGSDPR